MLAAFSLHRESFNLDPGRRIPHFWGGSFTDNVTVDEKYLGLLTREGRINKDKFRSTKEKLIRRFMNWVERNMSMRAKEVLIKSVA
jgi:hypothetical protein